MSTSYNSDFTSCHKNRCLHSENVLKDSKVVFDERENAEGSCREEISSCTGHCGGFETLHMHVWLLISDFLSDCDLSGARQTCTIFNTHFNDIRGASVSFWQRRSRLAFPLMHGNSGKILVSQFSSIIANHIVSSPDIDPALSLARTKSSAALRTGRAISGSASCLRGQTHSPLVMLPLPREHLIDPSSCTWRDRYLAAQCSYPRGMALSTNIASWFGFHRLQRRNIYLCDGNEPTELVGREMRRREGQSMESEQIPCPRLVQVRQSSQRIERRRDVRHVLRHDQTMLRSRFLEAVSARQPELNEVNLSEPHGLIDNREHSVDDERANQVNINSEETSHSSPKRRRTIVRECDEFKDEAASSSGETAIVQLPSPSTSSKRSRFGANTASSATASAHSSSTGTQQSVFPSQVNDLSSCPTNTIRQSNSFRIRSPFAVRIRPFAQMLRLLGPPTRAEQDESESSEEEEIDDTNDLGQSFEQRSALNADEANTIIRPFVAIPPDTLRWTLWVQQRYPAHLREHCCSVNRIVPTRSGARAWQRAEHRRNPLHHLAAFHRWGITWFQFDHDDFTFRSDRPWPRPIFLKESDDPSWNAVSYFEVEILRRPHAVGIGLVNETFPVYTPGVFVGWPAGRRVPNNDLNSSTDSDDDLPRPTSYAYHGDDGLKFNDDGTGRMYGPVYGAGDVVGCGLDWRRRAIFFTLNGKHIGVAFSNVDTSSRQLWFAAVSLKHVVSRSEFVTRHRRLHGEVPGEGDEALAGDDSDTDAVVVNFGSSTEAKPFMYDLAALYSRDCYQ